MKNSERAEKADKVINFVTKTLNVPSPEDVSKILCRAHWTLNKKIHESKKTKKPEVKKTE